MKVRIFGQLDFYAPTGRLGLKMAGIDPRFTLGELSQARDQVVRRARRRPGCSTPTAPGRCRRSRFGSASSPASVRRRGTTSATSSTAAATDSTSRCATPVCRASGRSRWSPPRSARLTRRGDLDCVVVIRGGGARNELATFDAESIALAIVTSPIPVLTGLGHEIDRSVADEVAHTALKTPTACAGALIDAVHDYQVADRAVLGRDRGARPPGPRPRRRRRCPIAPTASPAARTPPSNAPTSGSPLGSTASARRRRAGSTTAVDRHGGGRRPAASPRAAARRRRAAPSRRARRPAGAARSGQPAAARVEHHAHRRRRRRALRRPDSPPATRSVTRLADGEIASTVTPPPNREDPPMTIDTRDDQASPATPKHSPSSTRSCASSRAPTSTSTGSPNASPAPPS